MLEPLRIQIFLFARKQVWSILLTIKKCFELVCLRIRMVYALNILAQAEKSHAGFKTTPQ